MFGGLESNALEQIAVAKAAISNHEDFLRAQPSERRGSVRIYAVTSCVTRLYAVYEHFVESLISDYLDAIPELGPYAKLSDGLRKEYRIGISHILGKLDSERYGHLTHENVILWYHQAISNSPNYRFVTEALTRHDTNLRLNIVETLISRVDLQGFRSWLVNSEEIAFLYEEQTAIVEQLEAEIRSFVQLRNDAAHGSLQALEGRDNLMRYCELIAALVKTMATYFSRCLLLKRVEAGRCRKIGTVTEIFPRAGAFVAQLDAGSELATGMSVHVLGSNYYNLDSIQSLQVLDADVERLSADKDGFEAGLKCNLIPRRNAELYIDAPLRAA